jgi:hypothetical protein
MTAVEDPSIDGEGLSFWEQIEQNEDIAQMLDATGVGRRIRYGVHTTLEEAADDLIFGSLKKITSREEKSDILTPWKEKNRIGHEVYSFTGSPEPSIRQGMYNRSLNRAKPYLNSRDGLARNASSQENSIAMKYFQGAGGMGAAPDA